MATIKNSADQATKFIHTDVAKIMRSKVMSTAYLQDTQLTLTERVDVITGDLIYELESYFHKVDGRPLKVPADWWEHCKLRWAPQWFIKRWPVRLAKYTPSALFMQEPPLTAFTRGGILYYFPEADEGDSRDLTAGEKLNEALETLADMADTLHELSKDVDGENIKIVQKCEETILSKLNQLDAPAWMAVKHGWRYFN